MTFTVTILGCGSSGGVPRPALGWGACDPNNPKNRRRRCSILLERKAAAGITRVLIDTSPDLREQLIDAGVDHLDAVFLTHEHADQLHGIDDLRSVVLHMRRRIPVYMSQFASRDVLSRFGYCFTQPPGSGYPPILEHHYVEAGEERTIEGKGGPLTLKPFLVEHGNIPALGYRVGNAAYSPDMSDIPRQSLGALQDLDVWIIDALRYMPHPTHTSVDQALLWIEAMKPRRGVLTNMHTDLDYEDLRGKLPEGVVPAFDGMRIEVWAGE
jgi:phosphoribosyl 1,2-cyclic phosphate phosphodiesterase